MNDVASYYDRATRAFVWFGQGRTAGAIHRAVWGPGVGTRAEAFRFVEHEILRHAGPVQHVIDLGCGVGGSLAAIAEATPLQQGLGVTLSATQVELASKRFASSPHGSRLRAVQADFTQVPAADGTFDLAFAIESFVHGSDPAGFFAEAARLLKPGGRLIVCDDGLTARGANASGEDADTVERFVNGWHLGCLCQPAEAVAMAASAGFGHVSDHDWTPWLELRRPRDRVIERAVRWARPWPIGHPWWASLVGGDALQRGLLNGLLEYRCTVFARR